MVKEKVLFFPNFKAPAGWMDKWKKSKEKYAAIANKKFIFLS